MGIVCSEQRNVRSCIKQLTVLCPKSAVFSGFFFVKWCFWQSFVFVVYIFTLSSLVSSGEIEDHSMPE